MASKTEIAQLALLDIGDNTDLVDVDLDSREAAKIISLFWDVALDRTLEKHPWNFAAFRAVVAAESATPAFGFAFQYAFPTNPWAVRLIGLDGTRHPRAIFRVEGRKVLTDEKSPLHAHFVRRVTDTSLFTGHFVEVLAAVLAAKAAPRLTGKTTVAERLNTLADKRLREARSIDGQEGTPEDANDDDFLRSRVF